MTGFVAVKAPADDAALYIMVGGITGRGLQLVCVLMLPSLSVVVVYSLGTEM